VSSITFATAGEDWLRRLPDDIRRNGKPLSSNTQKVYRHGFTRAARVLGDAPLSSINNVMVREFVASLRSEQASPATILSILNVVKLITESVSNGDGNPVYPLKINPEFARVPRVIPEEQNAPAASREQIERALAIPELRGPVAIAAGCGLRISEILALTVAGGPDSDEYNSDAAVIHIRKTLKTPSARRSIPVRADLNAYLKALAPATGVLFPVVQHRIYSLLERAHLPPPHSYRRYFSGNCDTAGIHPGGLKKILGHAKNGITERYSRAAVDDLKFLRSEIDKIPLGFDLPEAAPLFPSLEPCEAIA
jgi:integrase